MSDRPVVARLPDDILDAVFDFLGPAAASGVSTLTRDWCRIFRARAVSFCPRGPWRSSLAVAEENAPGVKWINVGMTVSRFDNAVDHSPAAMRRALTDVLEGLGALHLPGLVALNVNVSRADRSATVALGCVLDARCAPRLRDLCLVLGGDTVVADLSAYLNGDRGLKTIRLKFQLGHAHDRYLLSTGVRAVLADALCAGVERVRLDCFLSSHVEFNRERPDEHLPPSGDQNLPERMVLGPAHRDLHATSQRSNPRVDPVRR